MSNDTTRQPGIFAVAMISLLSLGCSIGVAAPAQAGNLSLGDWDGFGDVSLVFSQAQLSTNGLMMDDAPAPDSSFNFSGNAAIAVGVPGGLEEFLGSSLGSLDPDPFQVAYEGSAIKKVLSVRAGDTLSFDWNFLSNDRGTGSGFGDYAFVAIDDVMTSLADVINTPMGSSSLFQRETGKNSFSYKFAKGGSFQVGVGVVDVGDFSMTSALSIENMQLRQGAIESVPEPTSLLSLLVLGSVGGASVLRRRQQ